MSENSLQVCPKCGHTYTEPPALSRLDNKTAICPTCGTTEALDAIPGGVKFPRDEALAVIAWMNEQMCGDKHTEWTYGDEHDRMREATDFLEGLCKAKMLKRVCSYSVFENKSRPGYDDSPIDSEQFTVFAPTSDKLDSAMEARFDEVAHKLPKGQFIDDCGWGADVPAEWSELTEEWV